MGVDNAYVEIDNLEVPILDGSGQPFVELIAQAGLKSYRRRKKYLRIRRPVSVEANGKRITILPSDRFLLTCDVYYPHPLIGRQSLALTHAVIGFRVSPHRVDRASRKWTWGAIAHKLGELAWGRRYLRQPALEVNKEALLADRAELSPVELRTAGLKIVQEERFYIAPHRETESAGAEEWPEAA